MSDLGVNRRSYAMRTALRTRTSFAHTMIYQSGEICQIVSRFGNFFFLTAKYCFSKAIDVSFSAWLGPYSTGFAGRETKNCLLQLISRGPTKVPTPFTPSHLTEPSRDHSTHRFHCASSKTNPPNKQIESVQIEREAHSLVFNLPQVYHNLSHR